eukprot:gb/GECG01015545.1/.p1 GENE.gb/GECG01015545.1/~~gb/GECG01015545.1/.p1  ORF type:complete len:203 (+),score=15.58 gb/GECG01015545.1/:1-609(+)
MFHWLTGLHRDEVIGRSLSSVFPGLRFQKVQEMIRLSKYFDSDMCSHSCRQRCLCKYHTTEVFLSVSLVRHHPYDTTSLVLTVLPLIYTDTPDGSTFMLNDDGQLRIAAQGIVEDRTECSLRFTGYRVDHPSSIFDPPANTSTTPSRLDTTGNVDNVAEEEAHTEQLALAPESPGTHGDPFFTQLSDWSPPGMSNFPTQDHS